MDYTTITRMTYIDARPEHVWDLLADLTAPAVYDRNVAAVQPVAGPATGVGAAATTDHVRGGTTVDRVTEWRPGERLTLAVEPGAGAPELREATLEATLVPVGRGVRLLLTWRYRLAGWLGAARDALSVRPRLSTALEERLDGLAHYASSGRPIDTGVLAYARATSPHKARFAPA